MQRRVFVKAPHMDGNIISHLQSVEAVQKYANNGGRGMYHGHGGLGSANDATMGVQFLARAVPTGLGADNPLRATTDSWQRLSPPEPIADYCMSTTAIGFLRNTESE